VKGTESKVIGSHVYRLDPQRQIRGTPRIPGKLFNRLVPLQEREKAEVIGLVVRMAFPGILGKVTFEKDLLSSSVMVMMDELVVSHPWDFGVTGTFGVRENLAVITV
jgi:hypothetical protein